MNYSFSSCLRPAFSGILMAFVVTGIPAPSAAQEKKATKPKTAAVKTPAKASAKSTAPASAKSPGAATQFDKHLAANMKLLNVLGRYADCLSSATDAATATTAVTKIEDITKEAITAGEEVVKLGHPAPVLEAKLGKDADLQLASRLVAEKTRAAVKSISENSEVKAALAPAIESFQAALNRIQQTAEDRGASGDSPADGKEDPATAKDAPAPSPAPAPAAPAPAVPARDAGNTASVPPPSAVPE